MFDSCVRSLETNQNFLYEKSPIFAQSLGNNSNDWNLNYKKKNVARVWGGRQARSRGVKRRREKGDGLLWYSTASTGFYFRLVEGERTGNASPRDITPGYWPPRGHSLLIRLRLVKRIRILVSSNRGLNTNQWERKNSIVFFNVNTRTIYLESVIIYYYHY